MKTTTQFLVGILTSLMLVTNTSYSQTLIPDFAMHFLAGTGDEIQKSTVDQGGNLYLVGTFKSPQLVFGTDTLTRRGDNDLFLVKMDADTNVVFCKSFYNNGVAKVTGIALDSTDNIYLTGYYRDSIRFDNFAFKAVSPYTWANSSFVVKTDPTGNAGWAKAFGGNSSSGSLVLDKHDNVYISGWFGESFTIQEPVIGYPPIVYTANPSNLSRGFLLKTNTAGRTQWLKSYGGELMIDKDQSLFFAGSYMDSIYLENHILRTYINKENHNVYLAKADTNGHVLWAKKFCEGEHALLNGAVIDTMTNTIFLTGTFKTDSLTFGDKIIRNHGLADIYIAKINTEGIAQMAKSVGTEDCEYSWGLTRISSEYMVLLGTTFSDSIVWGNDIIHGGTAQTGFGDMFLAVFDNDMNPVWGKGFPKSSGQELKGIVADANQNVYVVGDFCSTGTSKVKAFTTVATGTAPTYIEHTSLYLVKFKIGNTSANVPITPSEVISMYPNPTNKYLNVNVGNSGVENSILITSIEGKRVYAKPLDKGINAIDISWLSKGIYMVRVQSGDKYTTTKLIKNQF